MCADTSVNVFFLMVKIQILLSDLHECSCLGMRTRWSIQKFGKGNQELYYLSKKIKLGKENPNTESGNRRPDPSTTLPEQASVTPQWEKIKKI